MNNKELIDKLADNQHLSKKQTKEMVNEVFSVLSDKLEQGKGVTIPDLGTFTIKKKKARKVYSPYHKNYMMVPKKRVVDFSPSKNLKEGLKYTEVTDE